MIHREILNNTPGRDAFFAPPAEGEHLFFSQSHFHYMLRIERQRTERSKKPFLLMLIDISNLIAEHTREEVLRKIKSALDPSIRVTDIWGWYDHGRVIGIIFTEMSAVDKHSVESILRRIQNGLCTKFSEEMTRKMSVTFYIYPETNRHILANGSFNIKFYPELTNRHPDRQFSLRMKRVIDVVASAAGLLCCSPVFLFISVVIKATSRGPIFFKQQRLGLNGQTFNMLKFRSMYTNCDSVNHQEYIRKYICDQKNAAVEPGVFKLTNDPRITPIGGLLRKTSLDELPQLINVLKGDMSLVGPRPPLAYECDLYDIWHMRRLLACKPGITGLWQVAGRGRTTFDEMVRLDLKYIREWSLWLDLKILLKTPKAVLTGAGAY